MQIYEDYATAGDHNDRDLVINGKSPYFRIVIRNKRVRGIIDVPHLADVAHLMSKRLCNYTRIHITTFTTERTMKKLSFVQRRTIYFF